METAGSPEPGPADIVSACTSCTSVQPGGEEWQPIAEFLRRRFGLTVHAGVCPACLERYYPDLVKKPDQQD